MSKRQILCVMGVWLIILPFLGLPSSWKTVLFVITGLVLCILAYTGAKQPRNERIEAYSNTFAESGEQVQN